MTVNGARQAGKSTLTRLIGRDMPATWLSLDDDATLRAARADPVTFVSPTGPLVIDETEREHQVLARMAQGMTNPQIAAALVVSEAAVRKHVGNIFAKLPLAEGDRRVRAVLAYLRSGT